MFSAKDLFFAKGPAGGYTIAKSLRFRSSASAYLSRTPSVSGSVFKFTWSGWVKRGAISSSANQTIFGVYNGSGTTDADWFRVTFLGTGAGTSTDAIQIDGYVTNYLRTSALYRDPSAWYHVVVAVDTTSATSTITGTSTDRVRLYVNGVQITAFNVANAPTLNLNTPVDYAGKEMLIGAFNSASKQQFFDGYHAEVNFIDGQALDPTYFGQTDTATGVWSPKAYSGTGYGTNGFYLKFTDVGATSGSNTGYGKDFAGTNYWTTNNLSSTAGVTYDSMVDTPTNYDNGGNGAGNYCTLSPLQVTAASIGTASDGNLSWSCGSSATYGKIYGTMALPTSGKWYWEITAGTTANLEVGIIGASDQTTYYPGYSATGYVYYQNTGQKVNNNTFAAYGSSFTTNDVIGVAVDMDNGAIYFAKNNTWQNSGVPTSGASKTGAAFTSLTSTYIPTLGNEASGASTSAKVNFGQQGFTYTPPSGFKALNTQNLPTPTIGATSSTLANKYFDAATYAGAGTTQSVTNSGSFQPDLVWLKSRTTAGNSHYLYDVIRGTTVSLTSDSTAAEQTIAQTLTSFNSNGFTLGTVGGAINGSGQNFISWQWKANGSGSSNTSGSITSTVSANVTAGFSVVTFTAPATSQSFTVGHGLGVAPKMTIVKRRDSATGGDWWTWHIGLGDNTTDYLALNQTAAKSTAATMWGTVGRTSSVCGFNVPTSITANGTFVLYCFSEVAGYSKFGRYTGNGSTDGPFIFTGFRPRYILWKRTDTTSSWFVYDTSRSTYNVMGAEIYPNTSDAEAATTRMDFLSNGFKLRAANAADNASGGTYIYAAFAESPFNYSRAR